jgi:hypothetical protein
MSIIPHNKIERLADYLDLYKNTERLTKDEYLRF